MKVGIAMMSHETNTFSPVVTDLKRFSGGKETPPSGAAALTIYKGTASCLGGYIQVAEANDAEIVMGIAAGAPPSGPVNQDAYEFIASQILGLCEDIDALLLDLHGAMVTEEFEDGEGELLSRIREQQPDLPIAISLDMHANVTEKMVSNCDVLTGYHTYPHIDMDATAVRSAELFFKMLRGEVNPSMHWSNVPMLPHVMRQGTDDEPNLSLQNKAIQMEEIQALAVSVFTGFPHADIKDAGMSVVTVTDDNAEEAKQITDQILDQAWSDKEKFVYEIESLDRSMEKAKAASKEPGEGPVILLDHYDNTASGGTMDTTEVLNSILEHGLEDVAVFGFYDPEVVDEMQKAGVGNTVTISLGGKLFMDALEQQSKPLTLTGEVKTIFNGKFKAKVAMARGLTVNMGTTAILSVGSVDIIIVSRHVEPTDPECFRSLGIEPTEKTYLMLKSRIHYRVGFRDISKKVIECAGIGVCTSDYDQIQFSSVRRPIFPLDRPPEGSNEDWRNWSLN